MRINREKEKKVNENYLKEILHYDPDTGIFTWKKRHQGRSVHKPPGWVSPLGYVKICINRNSYCAHRLAWLYMTGSWPVDQIDHIDGTGSNNKWENLREADSFINNQNLHKSKGKSNQGYMGTHYVKKRKKWAASISVEGKAYFLGHFSTPEEAHKIYIETKRKVHPGNTV